MTLPAMWIAPAKRSSFSVSVVLPASGWEMMAKVRRRAASFAMVEPGSMEPPCVGKNLGPTRMSVSRGGYYMENDGRLFIAEAPRVTSGASTGAEACSAWGMPRSQER
jgi:hypothetical protein